MNFYKQLSPREKGVDIITVRRHRLICKLLQIKDLQRQRKNGILYQIICIFCPIYGYNMGLNDTQYPKKVQY